MSDREKKKKDKEREKEELVEEEKKRDFTSSRRCKSQEYLEHVSYPTLSCSLAKRIAQLCSEAA